MMVSKLTTRLFVLLLLSVVAISVQATNIVISNIDSADEGFNDKTSVSPVGGNPGVTLGEQRLNIFEHAAKVWEAVIVSNVTITVQASLDPLTCSASTAILGSAGATSVHGNFSGAPALNTYYPGALANSLANSDLSANPDISAQFNSDIDNNNNCLNNTNWYYGLDGNAPNGSIDMLPVILHEIGHGLGFQTFVDMATGAKFNGVNDTYMLNLEDHSTGQTWNQLSDAGRLASMIDTGDLHWLGTDVTALIGNYSAGVNQGHIRMHAPDPVNGGSSVSHFSNTVAPNELMEPVLNKGLGIGPGLALPLLQDIGWITYANASPVIAVLGDQSAQGSETIQVTVLVLDNDTPPGSLSLNAVSSNSAVVAASGLSFSGSGNLRTLSVTPKAGGSGNVTITITVSDASSSTSESFQLNVALNNPPVVTVTSPANGAAFLDTDFVRLQAGASDIEDGDVSSSLSWSSSIEGALGNGASLVIQLTEGVHTLTAAADDSLGASGSVNFVVSSYGAGDSDSDSLSDNWEFSNFGSLNESAAGDFDGDGLNNINEFNRGTTPTSPDTDGDGVSDGDEVNLYGLDPTQSDAGDIGPRVRPDGVLNAGDLVVMSRLVSGFFVATPLEAALADMNGDTEINAADLLLLQRAVFAGGGL